VHESPRNLEGPNRWTMSDGNLRIGTEPENIFYFVQVFYIIKLDTVALTALPAIIH
jgi:hypothetical protein